MVRLQKGEEVQVETEEWEAYGKIAGLTEDVIFTELDADAESYMTIHITDVVSGAVEVDTWQTCKVKTIVSHWTKDGEHTSDEELWEGE